MELERKPADISMEIYGVRRLIEWLVPRCPRCGKPMVPRLMAPSLREGYATVEASKVYVLVLECLNCGFRLASNVTFYAGG
jgi:ribosomal protein S27AE